MSIKPLDRNCSSQNMMTNYAAGPGGAARPSSDREKLLDFVSGRILSQRLGTLSSRSASHSFPSELAELLDPGYPGPHRVTRKPHLR